MAEIDLREGIASESELEREAEANREAPTVEHEGGIVPFSLPRGGAAASGVHDWSHIVSATAHAHRASAGITHHLAVDLARVVGSAANYPKI